MTYFLPTTDTIAYAARGLALAHPGLIEVHYIDGLRACRHTENCRQYPDADFKALHVICRGLPRGDLPLPLRQQQSQATDQEKELAEREAPRLATLC